MLLGKTYSPLQLLKPANYEISKAECEQLYDIKIVYGNVIKIKHLKRLRKKLYALKNAGNITFVHGIGKAHLET